MLSLSEPDIKNESVHTLKIHFIILKKEKKKTLKKEKEKTEWLKLNKFSPFNFKLHFIYSLITRNSRNSNNSQI